MNFYTHAAQGRIQGCILKPFIQIRIFVPGAGVPATGGMARAPPGAQNMDLPASQSARLSRLPGLLHRT